MGATSKWLFVLGLPSGSPKIVPVWIPGTLAAHNSLLKPLIGVRFEANLYLSLRAFQRCVALRPHAPGSGRVNSRLLVVESQTTSLTPSLSFAPNLCFRCPNGSCEAIFDIYTSRPFQQYKEHIKARCFYPYNRIMSFWESRRTPKSPFSGV
jgi:hypothetical protein